MFETVHSDEHDSWDTETKGHCFYNEALHSQLKKWPIVDLGVHVLCSAITETEEKHLLV